MEMSSFGLLSLAHNKLYINFNFFITITTEKLVGKSDKGQIMECFES